MMKTLACVASFAAFAMPVGAAAQQQAEQLAPITNWNLDYAADSCGLSRSFGSEDNPVMLQMRQYAPGSPLSVTVVGARNLRSEVDPKIGFGASQDNTGELMRPIELRLENGLRGVRVQTDLPSGIDENLTVSNVFQSDLRLETGSFQAAMNALGECQYSLLEYWELDAEAHRSLQSPARMSANDDWVETIIRRMPDRDVNAARNSVQWMLFFVDATGDITDCRALSPNTFERFAENFCELAIERGDVLPAVDASGSPIASVMSYGIAVRTRAEEFYTNN